MLLILLFGLNLLLVLNLFHLFLLSPSLLNYFNSSVKQISDCSQPSDHILHLIKSIINFCDLSDFIYLLLICSPISFSLFPLLFPLLHNNPITHSSSTCRLLLSCLYSLVVPFFNLFESSQLHLFPLPLLSLPPLLEFPLSQLVLVGVAPAEGPPSRHLLVDVEPHMIIGL